MSYDARATPQEPHRDWGWVPQFSILVVEKGVQQLQCKPESQTHMKWVPQPNQARNDSTPVHIVESLSTTSWKRVHISCDARVTPEPHRVLERAPILLILVVEKGTQQLQFKPESQPQRNGCPKPIKLVMTPHSNVDKGKSSCDTRATPEPYRHWRCQYCISKSGRGEGGRVVEMQAQVTASQELGAPSQTNL